MKVLLTSYIPARGVDKVNTPEGETFRQDLSRRLNQKTLSKTWLTRPPRPARNRNPIEKGIKVDLFA